MRIYISGKITGNPRYMTDFLEAEKMLKREYPEADIFNPADLSIMLPKLKHEEYMRFCFLEMDMSDAVYFLPNWKDSRGASMERGYAIAKGMIILESDDERYN